jgi:hypothetical protein
MLWGVESAMQRIFCGFEVDHLILTQALGGFSTLISIVAVIVFFTGCETTRTDEADANTIIRQPDKGEVHGEVGAMYGSSL